ncbi:uncharacterized protein BJ212DRAFT_1476047 [Suillus subaureus]|uniref:Uncharacterized protein n=1 Tax=Suillus subaureus TaxID=48587 RepID=A0A9P7EM28_9AGAM|nr:uncharacterized protein BJ212DRAFT_1476047 [Suillus subaureus]KAG1824765.1 hypothetical protein BJ212DRAFT_1476047 [Suillus subaureus]
MSLNNLTLSFHDRVEQRNIPSDLDEAIEIELHRAAPLLCPPSHSGRSVSGDIGAALAEEFKRLSFRLCNICMLPDLFRFFFPPLFSDLKKVAVDSSVIIVNASKYSCDALSNQDPIHIPLGIMRTEVSELSDDFQFLADKFGPSDYQHKLASILRKLIIALLTLRVQAFRESKRTLREEMQHYLSRIDFSSWRPRNISLRLVKQIQTKKELRSVASELAFVAQRIAPVVSSFASLEDSDATVEGALDALNHNQWLHLAYYGMPNR